MNISFYIKKINRMYVYNFFIQMKQKRFIFEKANEGKKPKEIQILLNDQFGIEAYSKTTVYKWAAQAKLGFDPEIDVEPPGPKPDEQLCHRILQVLEDKPFSSTRSIAEELNEYNSTIYNYLTKYLHRVYRSSKWLPHKIDLKQKQNRVTQIKSLLEILQASKHESYRNLLTGDQKWFNLYHGNDGAWIEPDQDSPQMIGDEISMTKVMVTIIWGVNGFFIVDFLPFGQSYNSEYFISNILEPLSEKRPNIWRGSKTKKIWLHLDNSKVHNSKLSFSKYEIFGFKRPPQPPYSPDVAPSDFYLFGYLDEKLKGHSFNAPEELFEAIIEILDSISTEKRKEVFDHWIDRCKWIINHNGDYYIK